MKRSLMMTLTLAAVGCASVEDAHLLPPTVAEDPALPRLTITVAGRQREVHVRTFGEPGRPVVLVMHGSLADGRYLLPLGAGLADRWQVVVWDQRGNGLSERFDDPREYSAAAIVEEIDAVADHFSPGRPFALVGHSFGAMYASLYASRRPERLTHLGLLEPGGLTGAIFAATYPDVVSIDLLAPGLNAMLWQNEILTPATHERLDLRALMMLQGETTRYFCDPRRPPDFPVWRPGGLVDILRGTLLQGSAAPGGFDFDFATGADAYRGPVLLVAGSCSALGPAYQERWHLPLFPGATLVTVEGAGHRFPVERPEETLAAVRALLLR